VQAHARREFGRVNRSAVFTDEPKHPIPLPITRTALAPLHLRPCLADIAPPSFKG
jgi:hypothetical protein